MMRRLAPLRQLRRAAADVQNRRCCLVACLAMISLLPGCRVWQRWREPTVDNACMVETCAPPTPVRIYVLDQPGVVVDRGPHPFTLELVAALNSTGRCEAILLPSPPQPCGPEQPCPFDLHQLEHIAGGPSENPGADELLLVQVTHEHPFRPLRLTAVLERRTVPEGVLINRFSRTWNGPIDDEPQGPRHIADRILHRPPPPGVVELHELERLSPRHFYRGVATGLLVELAPPPLPAAH